MSFTTGGSWDIVAGSPSASRTCVFHSSRASRTKPVAFRSPRVTTLAGAACLRNSSRDCSHVFAYCRKVSSRRESSSRSLVRRSFWNSCSSCSRRFSCSCFWSFQFLQLAFHLGALLVQARDQRGGLGIGRMEQ